MENALYDFHSLVDATQLVNKNRTRAFSMKKSLFFFIRNLTAGVAPRPINSQEKIFFKINFCVGAFKSLRLIAMFLPLTVK